MRKKRALWGEPRLFTWQLAASIETQQLHVTSSHQRLSLSSPIRSKHLKTPHRQRNTAAAAAASPKRRGGLHGGSSSCKQQLQPHCTCFPYSPPPKKKENNTHKVLFSNSLPPLCVFSPCTQMMALAGQARLHLFSSLWLVAQGVPPPDPGAPYTTTLMTYHTFHTTHFCTRTTTTTFGGYAWQKLRAHEAGTPLCSLPLTLAASSPCKDLPFFFFFLHHLI